MNSIRNNPMDDIKKLGDILLKRTSEKEYYRFLHIQEQCRLKWQANIDQIDQLMKEHKQLIRIKSELNANIKQITQLWVDEKQARKYAELERDIYKKKLQQTYELLQFSSESGDNQSDRNNNITIVNQQINDEITSTGSLLSSLSDVSITDDYCHKTSNTVLTSKDLNEIFLAPHETKISTPPTKQRMSDTIQEKTHALNAKAKCDEWLSPSKRPAMHLVLSSDEQSNASPLTGSSPIYEQVNDANCFSDIDNQEHNAGIVETTDESLYDIRFRSNVVDPQNCHHNFSHRTASRSEICFHCFKKFRFGILAFKCSHCKVYVHHDCKAQLKLLLKNQPPGKPIRNHGINDYVPLEGPSIPQLIVHCVNEVETRGLAERGIYRVSGSEREVKALKDRFLNDDIVPDLTNFDIHVICGCIKIFLRGLREPLIPTRKWTVFSNAVVDFDGDYMNGNIMAKLQHEIRRLPKANRNTLAFLILHLQRVATCGAVQMPISNLAKVFGPTVVGYSKSEPDHATILGETIIQQNVMQHLLNIHTDYWFSFISEDIAILSEPNAEILTSEI